MMILAHTEYSRRKMKWLVDHAGGHVVLNPLFGFSGGCLVIRRVMFPKVTVIQDSVVFDRSHIDVWFELDEISGKAQYECYCPSCRKSKRVLYREVDLSHLEFEEYDTVLGRKEIPALNVP